MANVIKIKKGLDINLKGKATDTLLTAGASETYAIVPDDYAGITPKVIVHPGDKVKAGTPLMYDKNRPEIKIVSPVSGEIMDVLRGEKRKVLRIVVKPDAQIEYVDFGKKDVSALDAEQLKTALCDAGMFAYIKQRPYDIVASPAQKPRDIFVAAFDSAPLAADYSFIMKEMKGEADLQTGLNALRKMTAGKVYVGTRAGSGLKLQGVEVVELEGPHPVGNVGVMINHIKPVNKGEIVWTVNALDVMRMGRLFNQGIADFTKLVVLTGSEMQERGYMKVISGCTIRSIVSYSLHKVSYNIRLISGNVLTGTKVSQDDYLGAFHYQITAIPEGDDVDEMLGWASPGFNKYSTSHTYFTWLMGKKKEYTIDARVKGGERAIIMSNQYDRVFPMDIMPEYLLKAIIAYDIDKMENLGIYEVAPEDFALCEFVDTSKIEIQKIVRNGLDLLYKEMN